MSAGFGIQDAIVATIGLAAAAWLVRRWRRRRRRGACACDGCPVAERADAAAPAAADRGGDTLISIEAPTRH
jgi:hypothetical protein